MRCMVVTEDNVWDFDTVGEARKCFNAIVDYARSGRTDLGEGARVVKLWRASWYYQRHERGLWPIEEWYASNEEAN